jgi:uncharacterized protein YraI
MLMRNWKKTLLGLVAGFAAVVGTMMPGQASAAMSAVAVTNVNMRAGPSTAYPVVIGLPSRAALTVYGCTANTSWCDVSWGRERGWVSANYVQVFYRGAPTVVTPVIAPAVGITVVSFNQTYWNTYYVGRPWYGQWNAYYRPGAYPPRGGAVGGCNDRGCGGAVVSPGHVAFGHCSDGTCSGTSINRGPLGRVWVRHGSVSRD